MASRIGIDGPHGYRFVGVLPLFEWTVRPRHMIDDYSRQVDHQPASLLVRKVQKVYIGAIVG